LTRRLAKSYGNADHRRFSPSAAGMAGTPTIDGASSQFLVVSQKLTAERWKLFLKSNVPTETRDQTAAGEFEARAGREAEIVEEWATSRRPSAELRAGGATMTSARVALRRVK